MEQKSHALIPFTPRGSGQLPDLASRRPRSIGRRWGVALPLLTSKPRYRCKIAGFCSESEQNPVMFHWQSSTTVPRFSKNNENIKKIATRYKYGKSGFSFSPFFGPFWAFFRQRRQTRQSSLENSPRLPANVASVFGKTDFWRTHFLLCFWVSVVCYGVEPKMFHRH